jgi:glycerate kinase
LLDISLFKERATDANLIITGEGRIDKQSLMGKIPGKILEKGRELGIPVVVLAGCVEDEKRLKKSGFTGIYAVTPKDMPLEEAMKKEVAIQNIKECVILSIAKDLNT